MSHSSPEDACSRHTHAEPRHNAARTRRWLPALVAVTTALTTGPRPAPGQDGPTRMASGRVSGYATLVGTVDDGLRGGPLAGAVILLDGQPRQAVTDSIGWFRLDSVAAGRYRVGIFHPILDSLGTSITTTPVTLVAGQPAVVTSRRRRAASIRRAVCPGVASNIRRHRARIPLTPPSPSSSVTSSNPTPTSPSPAPMSRSRGPTFASNGPRSPTRERHRETTSDSQGEFRFCGLPGGLVASVRARASRPRRYRSRRRARDRPRLPHHHDDDAAPPGARGRRSANAPAATTTTVANAPATPAPRAVGPRRSPRRPGQRPDGGPLGGASVEVEGTGDSSMTGDAGYFTIRGLPSGTHMLVVRSVGFEPTSVVVELTRRAPQHVVVAMMQAAYVLSPSSCRRSSSRAATRMSASRNAAGSVSAST